MPQKFFAFIINHTNRKTIIFFVAALVIAEVSFNFFLPSFVSKTGSTIIDMSPGISQDEIYNRLSSIEKAKTEYIWIRAIDFVFPVIYSLAFSFLSCGIFRKKYSNAKNYKWILVVPFIGAISDYLENFMLVFLKAMLPERIPTAVYVLNFFIIVKFIFIILSILLIITGLLSIIKGSDSSLIFGNRFKGSKNKKN